MYAVGEYVVHPGQGVCKVASIDQGSEASYKLEPVGQRRAMFISLPLSCESKLRPVLSAASARELINAYPSLELDTYTDRSLALEEEHFKKELRYGSCEDAVRIVKTFIQRIADLRAINKKPPVAYERILKEAKRRSLSEIACALEIDMDAVEQLFVF